MTIRASDDEITTRTRQILAAFDGVEAPLIEMLHAIQHEFGYVPEAVKPQLAEHLNLSRAEVHGVVSFYHDFRAEPAGRHTIKVCRAEACQSMGGEALAEALSRQLGVAFGDTSADGSVTLEPVYCLGLCACAPAALVDGRPVGRLDQAQVAAIAREAGR